MPLEEIEWRNSQHTTSKFNGKRVLLDIHDYIFTQPIVELTESDGI